MSQQEQTPPVLVYYPGHLGAEVVARLRGRGRSLRFTAGQVRLVPAGDAADLTHPSLGGYHRALPRAEAAEVLGIAPTLLGRLIAAGKVKTADYRPTPADPAAAAIAKLAGEPEPEPETVVVLDPESRRAARAEHPLSDPEPPPPPAPSALPAPSPAEPASAPAPLTATATPAKPKPARRKKK